MTIDIGQQYIITAGGERIGVVLDIETFRKIEEILEDCGLARYMEEVEGEEVLSLNEARQYYAQMSKE